MFSSWLVLQGVQVTSCAITSLRSEIIKRFANETSFPRPYEGALWCGAARIDNPPSLHAQDGGVSDVSEIGVGSPQRLCALSPGSAGRDLTPG